MATVKVPLDLFYRYSDTLNVGLGYAFRDSTIRGAAGPTADTVDHYIYLSAEGDLGPAFDVRLKLGASGAEFR